MRYIFYFLFLIGISGTQGQESSCPESALDCPSICICWKEEKALNTSQTQTWNKECHKCKVHGRIPDSEMLFSPPKDNAKEGTERDEEK